MRLASWNIHFDVTDAPRASTRVSGAPNAPPRSAGRQWRTRRPTLEQWSISAHSFRPLDHIRYVYWSHGAPNADSEAGLHSSGYCLQDNKPIRRTPEGSPTGRRSSWVRHNQGTQHRHLGSSARPKDPASPDLCTRTAPGSGDFTAGRTPSRSPDLSRIQFMPSPHMAPSLLFRCIVESYSRIRIVVPRTRFGEQLARSRMPSPGSPEP